MKLYSCEIPILNCLCFLFLFLCGMKGRNSYDGKHMPCAINSCSDIKYQSFAMVRPSIRTMTDTTTRARRDAWNGLPTGPRTMNGLGKSSFDMTGVKSEIRRGGGG